MSNGEAATSAQLSIEDLHAKIRSLEETISGRGRSISTALKLAPMHGNIMGVLMASISVPPEILRDLDPARTLNVKMAIHRLRKCVAGLGITIHGQRGIGYWLDDESKAKVRDLVVHGELLSAPMRAAC